MPNFITSYVLDKVRQKHIFKLILNHEHKQKKLQISSVQF